MKIPVRKSAPHVLSHHYDPAAGHLTVTFHGGRVYRYHGVDPTTASRLAEASSKGSFLHAAVIGKFRHTKIGN